MLLFDESHRKKNSDESQKEESWKSKIVPRRRKEIDKLLLTLESFNPEDSSLKAIRKDADQVHSDGFYFFNISVHRTMILIELEEEGEATIVWAGSHQEYEIVFKNNKKVIEKWLKNKGYITS